MSVLRTIRRELRIQRFVARRNPWLVCGVIVCALAALPNVGCTARMPEYREQSR